MANGLILNVDTTKSEFQNPMVELRQGDGNYQSLHVTVTNNGEQFDLTGWTITFMGTTAGSHKIVDANAVIDNALQGTFNYTPTKAWGQDEGEFKNAYFKFTKADETASGASFRVNVLDAVDLTAEEAGDYISVVDQTINKLTSDMAGLVSNVNDLKAQNNNIKTSDNTWTGTNTFNNKIIAQSGVQGNADSASRLQTKHNINGVGFDGTYDITAEPVVHFIGTDTDLFTLSNGFYYFNGVVATNKPVAASNWFTVEVIQADTNGFMRLIDSNGLSFWTTKSAGYWWSSWHKDADDSTVVHNTGTETVAGDKKFTGANTFSGINNFNAAQNFNGGVIGLGYSSLLNKGNGLNVIDSGVQQTTDGGQSWHKLANEDSVVHLFGTEIITGNKKFTGNNSVNGVPVLAQSSTVEFPMWYSSKMKATRFGNIVVLGYSQNPTQDIPSGITSQETVPTGFRPSFDWYMSQGGVSTSGGSSVKVKNSGNLSVVGPVSVSYPYTMTATYFTSDPFPS